MQSEFFIFQSQKLFLSLAESIAQTLDVTSCYVYGRINLGDHWPWEAKELNSWEHFDEIAFPSHRKCLVPKNFHHWKLLYFPSKRPVLHPGGGSNLFRTKVLQWHRPEDPMMGNSTPLQPPPVGQLLWSLGSLGQSYCEHRLAGTQGAILDLWETSL
jgi:hypothetical protein